MISFCDDAGFKHNHDSEWQIDQNFKNFCWLIMSIQVPTEDNCELELYTLLIYLYYSLNYTDKLNTARAA